jgi:hypothetical protein
MTDLYLHKGHALIEVKPERTARLVRFSPKTDFLLSPTATKVIIQEGGKYQLDVVFEVPEDFKPWYIEFKRGARVELSEKLSRKEPMDPIVSGSAKESAREAADESGKEPAKEAGKQEKGTKASKDKAPPVEVGAAPGGRTHVADAIKERTGVSAELPVPLNAKDSQVGQHLRSGKLYEGHFAVDIPEDGGDGGEQITEFYVPKDKRMVQIGAEQTIPLSMLGTALNYAAKVAAQVRITATDGRQFFAQGVYSAARVSGKLVFEIQYWPEAEVPERLKEPLRLTASVMKQAKPSERKFGYLFLVDPGVEITSFSTGGGGGGGQRVKIAVPE